MAETDDELESIASPSRPEERRQAALRQTYDERQAALEAELQKRAALIKEQYGAELEKQVSVAGVEDTEIKALAVDHMARSIAAKAVEPPQISGEDMRRLADQSIEQAYKLHDAQQQENQQRDPMEGVQPHKRDYGELQHTHEQVAGIERTSSAAAQDEETHTGRVDRVAEFLKAENLDRESGSAILQATAEPQAATVQQQAALDPLLPVEIQDHSPTETHTGRVDRVAEFLKAENLDREARKAILQELGRAAGREVTQRESQEISSDFGGGQSL